MVGECPCFVPVSTKKDEGKILSALQLKKGLRKGELTYLATLRVESNDQDHSSAPPLLARPYLLKATPLKKFFI